MSETLVQLKDGEAALFGYGSLLSLASMERTLARSYQGPLIPCELRGWRRTWDVAMPNQTVYTQTPAGPLYPENVLYLNVRRDPCSAVNGILYIVSASDLEVFDRREWIYDRENVTVDLCRIALRGGNAYVYVGKPQFILPGVTSPRRAAVRKTYLEIVESGLSQLGEAFRAVFRVSSDPVPAGLVIDDRLSERTVSSEAGVSGKGV
jgi:hypothetical protein